MSDYKAGDRLYSIASYEAYGRIIEEQIKVVVEVDLFIMNSRLEAIKILSLGSEHIVRKVFCDRFYYKLSVNDKVRR